MNRASRIDSTRRLTGEMEWDDTDISTVSANPLVRPKMVAIDVDDTLLEADLQLRDECIEAVEEARRLGVRVVLATGRMFSSVRPYAERLGLDGYLITYNGGLVRSLDGETLWHKPVPAESARHLIEVADREGFCLNLYVDDTLIVASLDDERVQYYVGIAGVDAVQVPNLEEALEQGEPTKCLFVGDARRVPDFIERLRADFPELQISGSKPRFVEVTRKGIHKEIALEAVAEAYHVPMEAVMAIGDGENDATMIARAGWGVAVANASDGAKRVANIVTEAPRGAGVCEALRQYVLG